MNIIIIILILLLVSYFLIHTTEHYTDPNYGLRAPVHVVLDRDGNALETLPQWPRGYGRRGCALTPCPGQVESNNTTCWCCCNYDN